MTDFPDDTKPMTDVEAGSIATKQSAITASKREIPWFGWKPDLPDHNDKRFAVPLARSFEAAGLPQFTTNFLGHTKIPIFDQGELGSCTANAALRAWRIMLLRTVGGLHYFDPSRLAHYYWTRELGGDPVDEDTGAYIRDAMKVFSKVGVTREALWPYDVHKFDINPGAYALAKAGGRLKVTYRRVPQDANTIRAVLRHKRPIVFGMSVFASTVDALDGNGQIPAPSLGERVLGGHAMMIEDYDDVSFDEPVVIGANSWGDDVGLGSSPEQLPPHYRREDFKDLLGGYFALPMSVLVDPSIADDLWMIEAAA